MPAVSRDQYRLMQAVLHGKPRKGGPSKKVAREFVDATPPKKRSEWSRASRDR